MKVNGLSQAAIGRAIGLSPAAMTKLKGQGMPVDSVESARAWRTERQNIAARKPERVSAAAAYHRPMYEQPALAATDDTAPASQPSAAAAPTLSASEIYKAAMASKSRYEDAYGESGRSGGAGAGGFGGLGDAGQGETHDLARTRREISEANQAEMREHEQRGELLRLTAIKATLASAFASTRDALLQLPARLAPLLAADSDPASVQNMLHTEIHQALHQLSGTSDRLGQPEVAP